MLRTLIHSVRIFDGESLVTENGYIVFQQDGLIEVVSTQTPAQLPSADTIIDGSGHTILPGLIDAHVHVLAGVFELAQALKFGVTTVLDMFNDPDQVVELKKAARERTDIADIRSAGYAAKIKNGHPKSVLLATAPNKEEVMRLTR